MTTPSVAQAPPRRDNGLGPPPAVDREYVIQRNGKQYALYAGVLDAAHKDGLRAITTTLVQIPHERNEYVAIVHATVETDRGVFSALGDASPDNVNKVMANALVRLAETRSKARALKDAINCTAALADDPESEAATAARGPSARERYDRQAALAEAAGHPPLGEIAPDAPDEWFLERARELQRWRLAQQPQQEWPK